MGGLMLSTHTLFEWLVGLHIATGSVGLIIIWIPIAGRKGGQLHRRAGTLFVQSMIATGFTAVGTVNAGSALLLRDTDLVRYVPDQANGESASFDFRAWDQTSGANGDAGVDTTTNGGTTAFSVDTDTAAITVFSTNSAPVNTVPGPLVTDEDDPLVINSISVTDPDGNLEIGRAHV